MHHLDKEVSGVDASGQSRQQRHGHRRVRWNHCWVLSLSDERIERQVGAKRALRSSMSGSVTLNALTRRGSALPSTQT